VLNCRRYDMPGVGPVPKDPSRRARRNKDPRASVVLHFEHGEQPALPDSFPWHEQTYVWWHMWGRSPMAELFTDSDWQFLAETAIFHTSLWNGNLNAGAELRLRVAKFGMTPEDRARLRIVFADADEKDEKRGTKGSSGQAAAGSAYEGLRAVPKTS
jgi:hypothetical protein